MHIHKQRIQVTAANPPYLNGSLIPMSILLRCSLIHYLIVNLIIVYALVFYFYYYRLTFSLHESDTSKETQLELSALEFLFLCIPLLYSL